MSSGTASEHEKRALYWLGERLIDYRHPVMIVVLIITGREIAVTRLRRAAAASEPSG